MGKFLIFLLGVVVGVVGMMAWGVPKMLGVGAGAGIVTGVCYVVDTGRQLGLLTDDQITEILTQAATNAGATLPEGTDLSVVPGKCAELLAKVK